MTATACALVPSAAMTSQAVRTVIALIVEGVDVTEWRGCNSGGCPSTSYTNGVTDRSAAAADFAGSEFSYHWDSAKAAASKAAMTVGKKVVSKPKARDAAPPA